MLTRRSPNTKYLQDFRAVEPGPVEQPVFRCRRDSGTFALRRRQVRVLLLRFADALNAGAKSPGQDKENNWLPAPDGTFSLYLRSYWPEKTILDGTWTPPSVEKVK